MLAVQIEDQRRQYPRYERELTELAVTVRGYADHIVRAKLKNREKLNAI